MSKRRFETSEIMLREFKSYAKKCIKDEKFPNIAGFCVHCEIHRGTYYEYQHIHPDAIKRIDTILEDITLNAKIPTAEKIFYMKNKFKDLYKDKQEIEHSGDMVTNINIVPASKKEE